MRIAIFTDTYSPEVNGVVTSIRQLEKELIKNGHEVFIITSSSYKRIIKEENVIMMPGITMKKLYGYHASNFYSIIGANYIRKLKLDVIHAQTEYGIGIFARIIAMQLELPLVYTYHTMLEDYSHYATKYTRGKFESTVKKIIVKSSKVYANRCTELIVPSQKTKDAMKRYGVKNKINIVPTGIDLEMFSKQLIKQNQIVEMRKEYGFNNDDFIAVYIGRVASEKSIEDIIRSFELLKGKKDNIKFLIVGGGPSVEELKQLVKDKKLENTIKLIGKVSYDKVAYYYHLADVFISTSTSETQGLTFIEAMACKLPVIAAHDKNLEHIIIENKTGYYVSNEQELAQKLMKLEQMSSSEFDVICQNAYEIATQFSSKIFYERMIKIYESAIRKKKSALLQSRKNAQKRIFISSRIR